MQAGGPPQPTIRGPRPLAACLGLLLPLLGVLGVAALLLGAALGGLRWTVATEDGTRWLLARLPGVEVSGLQGTLQGGSLQAKRLRIVWDGGKQSLTLDDVSAEGLRWTWRPAGGPRGSWLTLDARHAQARQGTLLTGPHNDLPLRLPASLALPLQLTVEQAEVQTFQIDKLAPLLDVQAQGFRLDSGAGASHGARQFALQWQGYAIAGQGWIGHAAPMPVQLSASIRALADGDTPRWAAVLRADGPVTRMAVQASLRGVPHTSRANHAAPSLDLACDVLPLQAWPLGRLRLQTQELDLGALHPAAPETRLSGSAQIDSRALNAPVSASLSLDNAAPGRWSEGRLPLSRLSLEVSGRVDQPQRITAPRFELQLADAPGPAHAAGRWSGSAVWQGHTLTLDSQLDQVLPQRLDGRAAAMRVSGPLALVLHGLPSPDPADHSALPALQAQWKVDLDGHLDGAPQAVQLKLEGSADAQRVLLQQARAQTGSAVAELNGSLQRGPRGDWALASAGTLSNFDPVPWFPGDAGSAWRQGPHRLSGSWQFDVRLPADAAALARQSPLALAQRVAGNGKLRINDALLAGVPMQAEAVLTYAPLAAPASASLSASQPPGDTGSLHAELRMAGNTLLLDGRGDPAGSGSSDRWRAELTAEHLAGLAPLTRLHPLLADWLPRQGSAQMTLAADGRWPLLRTEGNARAQQVQLGAWTLARGQADWQVDSRGSQPLAMHLDLSGLQRGEQRAEQLRGTVQGTLAAHRIDIEAALPVAPSGTGAQLLAGPAGAGTRAQLRAQGAWTPDPAGGGLWRTVVERLQVAPWDRSALANATAAASASAASSTASWADASDLRGELQFDASSALLALSAEAGRLRLADSATLRWDAVRLEFQGPAPRIELRAEVEPFNAAPVLARLQPEMGWRGDLRLAGKISVQAGERFDADLSLARTSGDLQLPGVDSPQALGLSELRLAVSAHDGVWIFKPDLAGQALGELHGTAQVTSTAAARWPAPDAPLQGSLQLRVADIGIWNAWIPPGWRMTGSVQGMATLGGRFGDPRTTGEMTGSALGLRNLLQGVNVGEGEVTVRLDGDSARIDRFALRGGEGTLAVSGTAKLGAAPSAQLELKAERFRVLGRVDRQLIASGQAEMTLSAEALKLDGKLVVDEGLIDASRSNAPSLDDDVSVRRAKDEAQPAPDAGVQRQRRGPAVNVNLAIDLGDKLRIRGHGLDTVLEGKLRLTTPGGKMAVAGSINTVGGTYAAYGQKLAIERGIVAFSGAVDNPRLDVLALRPNIDTRVGVSITGNLLTPRVRLTSDGDLSDNEKLSWLVLGRAPAGLGRTDTALLQRAAVALLAGEGEAPTDALLRNLGIDELSLRQGDSDVRETVISLGKQLSRRWYVGYERGVNSTTGTWQLIYRIAQRFTLRAQSGLENSLDVIWVWRLGETPARTASDPPVRKSVTLPP